MSLSKGVDGICYRSRYGDDIEDWAVFEPFTAIRPRTPTESLDRFDADCVAEFVVRGSAARRSLGKRFLRATARSPSTAL